MTYQQIIHKANGIARIAQAVKLCDLAPVETGTIYSKRLKILRWEKEVNQYGFITPMRFYYEYEKITDSKNF